MPLFSAITCPPRMMRQLNIGLPPKSNSPSFTHSTEMRTLRGTLTVLEWVNGMEYTYDPPDGVPSFIDTRPTRAPLPPLTSMTMSAVFGAGGAAEVLLGAGGGAVVSGSGGVVASGSGGGGGGAGWSVRVTVVVAGGGGGASVVAGSAGSAGAGGSSEGELGGASEAGAGTGGMREVRELAAGASCFAGQARYATRPAIASRESVVPAVSPFDGPLGPFPAGSCGAAGAGASSRRYGYVMCSLSATTLTGFKRHAVFARRNPAVY